jgi:hypothetical protein
MNLEALALGSTNGQKTTIVDCVSNRVTYSASIVTVHDSKYLCKRLLEVMDRLGITWAVMSVTRDNACPNDTMLEEFEAVVATQ